LEIIKKAGSWFSYEGNKIGQGRDSVKQILLDNPEMCEEIEAKIRAKFADDKANAGKVLEDKGLVKPAFAEAD
jgi:recombination protein RecA